MYFAVSIIFILFSFSCVDVEQALLLWDSFPSAIDFYIMGSCMSASLMCFAFGCVNVARSIMKKYKSKKKSQSEISSTSDSSEKDK